MWSQETVHGNRTQLQDRQLVKTVKILNYFSYIVRWVIGETDTAYWSPRYNISSLGQLKRIDPAQMMLDKTSYIPSPCQFQLKKLSEG